MVRSSNSNIKTPRRSRKSIRSRKRRAKKTRLVNKRHVFGNEVTLPKGVRSNTSRKGDEGKSDDRKDRVEEGSIRINQKDRLEVIVTERGKIYGDPFLFHQAIGLAWEGVFRNRYHGLIGNNIITRYDTKDKAVEYKSFIGKLFPADLVVEMLAAFKIVRLARPIFKQDSADDAKIYISFSERFRK